MESSAQAMTARAALLLPSLLQEHKQIRQGEECPQNEQKYEETFSFFSASCGLDDYFFPTEVAFPSCMGDPSCLGNNKKNTLREDGVDLIVPSTLWVAQEEQEEEKLLEDELQLSPSLEERRNNFKTKTRIVESSLPTTPPSTPITTPTTEALPDVMIQVYRHGILHWLTNATEGQAGSVKQQKAQQHQQPKTGFKRSCSLSSVSSQQAEQVQQPWDGYLPLTPYSYSSGELDNPLNSPSFEEERKNCRYCRGRGYPRRRCRRHHRLRKTFERNIDINFPPPIPPYNTSNHQPNLTIPINCHSNDEWEIIFYSSEEAVAAQAQNAAVRRPPQASHSASLPSGVPNKQKAPSDGKKHGIKPGGQIDSEQVKVRVPGADRSAIKELPALRDAPPAKREELFVQKLKLCSVIFSFDDPAIDKRGKDLKRQTLLELVDYVNTPAGQKIFSESIMSDLMQMVNANVCRALPPATDDFDPEEDEPVLEPAWPHLQVAYEFFLRFIVSSEVNAKAAKKYVDQKFCLQLVELFDSEDPRERDYLKTILHRIYGKFMSHRSFIRRSISNVFYRFVYETERHNGIGELLEILGSIINGFAIPLKKEHLQFLVRALIPLHKPKCVALYHQQLSYCIIQYVEKDADTATPILNGFFKCWPWSSSAKQVMFLNELEEILELLGADQLQQVSTMLFTNLARCLDSDHFQVVERALFLWNNEHLVNSGCLSRLNATTVLPIIYRPLYKNSAGHWNATVEGLAQNVLKMYMEYDLVLYDKCTKAYYREEEEAQRKLEALEQIWRNFEKKASANHIAAIEAPTAMAT